MQALRRAVTRSVVSAYSTSSSSSLMTRKFSQPLLQTSKRFSHGEYRSAEAWYEIEREGHQDIILLQNTKTGNMEKVCIRLPTYCC
jgi:hypothetical protein